MNVGFRALRPGTWALSTWIVALTFALACGLYAYQLSVPQIPFFYDTGVYVTGALNFVSGSMPYRDFTFVNPPGILYILAPAALLGKVTSSYVTLIIGRWMGVIVTAAAAATIPWMLRRYGVVAMVIGGVGAATTPLADTVSSAVKLNAYCLFLSLLGAALVLARLEEDSSRPDRRGKWVTAGLLYGLAGATLLWAIFPFLALLSCVAIWRPRRVGHLVLGAAAGFVIPALPFLIRDFGAFFHQVIGDQLSQPLVSGISQGWQYRVNDMAGFVWLPNRLQYGGVAIVLFATLAFIARLVTRRGTVKPTEVFFVVSALITISAFLAAPEWNLYWAYFDSPFLLGLIAIEASRMAPLFRAQVRRLPLSAFTRRFSRGVLSASAVVALIGLAVSNVISYQLFALSGLHDSNMAAIQHLVPRNSCVVYTFILEGVYSDRLSPTSDSCSAVVDPYGMFLSVGMDIQHPPRRFVREWKSYFTDASYVVLSGPNTSYVPWTAQLHDWFNAHYRLVYKVDAELVYENAAASSSVRSS